MISWFIVFIALLFSGLWAVMFLKQIKSGLVHTALDDHFTWGLYVQGFFFFSALAGGVLVFMAVATLFEMTSIRPLAEIGSAVALGCLAAAGLLLGSDLGKPFRGLKILTGEQFRIPSHLGLLHALRVRGAGPPLPGWPDPVQRVGRDRLAALCLLATLGYVMVDTLFCLSRVGAGFRSQPFLGRTLLPRVSGGGLALMNLIALASGLTISHIGKLLLALSCLLLYLLQGRTSHP